eukprot:CFRG7763T1
MTRLHVFRWCRICLCIGLLLCSYVQATQDYSNGRHTRKWKALKPYSKDYSEVSGENMPRERTTRSATWSEWTTCDCATGYRTRDCLAGECNESVHWPCTQGCGIKRLIRARRNTFGMDSTYKQLRSFTSDQVLDVIAVLEYDSSKTFASVLEGENTLWLYLRHWDLTNINVAISSRGLSPRLNHPMPSMTMLRNTIIKRAPVSLSVLSANQSYAAVAGELYDLIQNSVLSANADHMVVTLSTYPGGVWYVPLTFTNNVVNEVLVRTGEEFCALPSAFWDSHTGDGTDVDAENTGNSWIMPKQATMMYREEDMSEAGFAYPGDQYYVRGRQLSAQFFPYVFLEMTCGNRWSMLDHWVVLGNAYSTKNTYITARPVDAPVLAANEISYIRYGRRIGFTGDLSQVTNDNQQYLVGDFWNPYTRARIDGMRYIKLQDWRIATAPTISPTPTPTLSPTPTPTLTRTPTPTHTSTSSRTRFPSPTRTRTPTPTSSPTRTSPTPESKIPTEHETLFNDPSTLSASYPGVNMATFPRYDLSSTYRTTLSRQIQSVSGQGVIYAIKSGTYTDVDIRVSNGAVLKAYRTGEVVFQGNVRVIVESGGVLDGITFTNANPIDDGLVEVEYGRITRCTFINLASPTSETNSKRCIHGTGAYALVDHNAFENVCLSSLTIVMSSDGPSITYRNRFIKQCDTFTAEVWRVGGSAVSYKEAFSYVDENYFADQNGEHELLSIKASRVFVRRNTITDCSGSITNRYGDRNTIIDNHITCTSKSTGGIRSFGRYQVISNNYISDCYGEKNQYGIGLGIGQDCQGYEDGCNYVIGLETTMETNTLTGGSPLNVGGNGKPPGSCPTYASVQGNSWDRTESERDCLLPVNTGGSGGAVGVYELLPGETGPF